MTNEQLAGARAAMADFPEMKVTIGRTEAGETITPYLAADVFTRGEDVLITPNMDKEAVRKAVRGQCMMFRSQNGA